MGSFKVAGIDVHKKMLAVVITDAAVEGAFHFERRKFGTMDSDLRELSKWLAGHGVQEAVMESTAQYWKPVWRQLEPQCKLYLAQAQSNRAPRGRKRDFADAERLVRRQVAGELILSFVPDPEQRLWRTVTRTKYQLTGERVRLHSQLEALLEDARIKLSSCVSDLLGVSSRRMMKALAEGETDPTALAKLADPSLRATPEELADALAAAMTLSSLHRKILGLFLSRLELIERQIETLDQSIATALQKHNDAVVRLAEVPGYGPDSAQQIIAEVGPEAATFPSAAELASWVGCCPGREESAEVSKTNRSPKGNRQMRRVLAQVAHAAVQTQGSTFQALFRRLVGRLGYNKAMWAVVHRLCRLTWKILHQGVRYEERGALPDPKLVKQRKKKLVRQLQDLGYEVQLIVRGEAPATA
ncbi:MAG TPA: IS110 family transposase [Bryobacteraceae bacterium]|nr:IS110 family transposase [Bryobacteraceae bacterium]